MTAIRFQFYDTAGRPQLGEAGGVLSAPRHTTAEYDARRIMADLATSSDGLPDGWSIQLWKDVPLFGGLASLGKPAVELVAPCGPAPMPEARQYHADCVLRALADGPLSRNDLDYRLSSPSEGRWFSGLLDEMDQRGMVSHSCDHGSGEHWGQCLVRRLLVEVSPA